MRTIKEILGDEEYSVFAIKGFLNPIYWIEKVSGYKLSWFAKEWINAMQKNGKVNLIAFRGSSKTEVMAVWYTLWLVWYKQNLEILITGHAREHAWKIMTRIKENILNNELLQKLKPENREETWNNEYITTNTKCNIYTRAYKKTIAGLRTDYIINDETSKCEDDDSYSTFHRVIEGTGHLRNAKHLCMTTPESPTDLCYELKNNKYWKTFQVPIMNEKGESNWPELYPIEKIKEIRESMGEHAFQQEYMLNPSAQAENPIYPPGDIVNCFDEKSRFESKPLDREKGYRVLAADFAVAKGPKADFDAYTVVELLDGKIYLKHGERHRGYPKPAKVERLKALFRQHDCHQIVVDPSGIGTAVLQDLRRDFLPVSEQQFHSVARSQLLMSLKIAIDDAKLIIPRDPESPLTITYTNILFNEMIGFKEEKIQGGKTRYLSKAPHDDSILEGTGILTNKGIVNIEDIKIGDKVLTTNGKYNEVINTFSKTEQKQTFSIKPFGSLEFTTTDNHKIAVINKPKNNARTNANTSHIYFVNSQELDKKKHLLIEPISKCVSELKEIDMVEYLPEGNGWEFNNNYYWNIRWKNKNYKRFIKVDEDFCFFIGHFAGDGCHRGDIAFHKKDKKLITKIKKYLESLGINVRERKEIKNSKNIEFCCIPFQNFLKKECKSHESKQLPNFTMFLEPKLQMKIFEGYFAADGSNVRNSKITASISKKLSYQIKNILLRNRICCNIRQMKRHRYNIINKDQYWVEISNENWTKKHKKYVSHNSFIKNGFLIKSIKNIEEKEGVDNFYDLEVKKDPVFCVEGTLVHNCAISLAMGVKACSSKRPFIDMVGI